MGRKDDDDDDDEEGPGAADVPAGANKCEIPIEGDAAGCDTDSVLKESTAVFEASTCDTDDAGGGVDGCDCCPIVPLAASPLSVG